jgi:6,7-dimethyl-8-ribityllumazine synthase
MSVLPTARATRRIALVHSCWHRDIVASAVIDGLMHVQLDTGVPVFSVVLTPHHFHEHEQHRQFYFDHFVIKGQEAAQACVRTLDALDAIRPTISV